MTFFLVQHRTERFNKHIVLLSLFLSIQPVSWWIGASWHWLAQLAACRRAAFKPWPTPCTSPISLSSAPRWELPVLPAHPPVVFPEQMTTPWWSAHLFISMRSSCKWCLSTAGRSLSFSTIQILVRQYLFFFSVCLLLFLNNLSPMKTIQGKTYATKLVWSIQVVLHGWFNLHDMKLSMFLQHDQKKINK